MSNRLPDWEVRLSEYITDWQNAEFSYGNADCAKFAAGAACAQTGIDHYAKYAGTYASKAESLQILRDIGDGTLNKTFSLHFEKKKAAFAQTGDIVFDGRSVGIFFSGLGLFIGEEDGRNGLVSKPLHQLTSAWAV
ncbi:MAG: DUF6950 family protein [Shewanella sp.]